MTTQQLNHRLPTKVSALIVGASTFLLGFLFLIVFADSASAHGYIESLAIYLNNFLIGKSTQAVYEATGLTAGNEGSLYLEWDAKKAYVGGDKVQYDGAIYEAKWWTYN